MMDTTPVDAAEDVLPTLLQESARFVDAMLATVAAPVRAHVRAAVLPMVVIAVSPPTVRLLLQTPDGQTECLTSVTGSQVPIALGTATAAFLDAAMQRVSEPWRAVLSSGEPTVAVSVVVDVLSATAYFVVDEGSTEPRVLATLTLADQEIVH